MQPRACCGRLADPLQVAYAVTILPISFTRLCDLGGMNVPLWADGLTGVIFNLSGTSLPPSRAVKSNSYAGFVNVVLFFGSRRFFPEAGSIPAFTERKDMDRDTIVAQHGVTPFTLQRPESIEGDNLQPSSATRREFPDRVSSRRRVSMASSVNSLTPLRPS